MTDVSVLVRVAEALRRAAERVAESHNELLHLSFPIAVMVLVLLSCFAAYKSSVERRSQQTQFAVRLLAACFALSLAGTDIYRWGQWFADGVFGDAVREASRRLDEQYARFFRFNYTVSLGDILGEGEDYAIPVIELYKASSGVVSTNEIEISDKKLLEIRRQIKSASTDDASKQAERRRFIWERMQTGEFWLEANMMLFQFGRMAFSFSEIFSIFFFFLLLLFAKLMLPIAAATIAYERATWTRFFYVFFVLLFIYPSFFLLMKWVVIELGLGVFHRGDLLASFELVQRDSKLILVGRQNILAELGRLNIFVFAYSIYYALSSLLLLTAPYLCLKMMKLQMMQAALQAVAGFAYGAVSTFFSFAVERLAGAMELKAAIRRAGVHAGIQRAQSFVDAASEVLAVRRDRRIKEIEATMNMLRSRFWGWSREIDAASSILGSANSALSSVEIERRQTRISAYSSALRSVMQLARLLRQSIRLGQLDPAELRNVSSFAFSPVWSTFKHTTAPSIAALTGLSHSQQVSVISANPMGYVQAVLATAAAAAGASVPSVSNPKEALEAAEQIALHLARKIDTEKADIPLMTFGPLDERFIARARQLFGPGQLSKIAQKAQRGVRLASAVVVRNLEPLRQIEQGLDEFASKFKSDYSLLLKLYGSREGLLADLITTACIESGFNRNAVNPETKAAGPFQFLPSTAARYGLSDPTSFAKAAEARLRYSASIARHMLKGVGRVSPLAVVSGYHQGEGNLVSNYLNDRLVSGPNNAEYVLLYSQIYPHIFEKVRLRGGRVDIPGAKQAETVVKDFFVALKKDENAPQVPSALLPATPLLSAKSDYLSESSRLISLRWSSSLAMAEDERVTSKAQADISASAASASAVMEASARVRTAEKQTENEINALLASSSLDVELERLSATSQVAIQSENLETAVLINEIKQSALNKRIQLQREAEIASASEQISAESLRSIAETLPSSFEEATERFATIKKM